ncbi:MAG: hypothetical protein QXZ51_03370 [Candidatus Bathyarchaeia archaeon]
MELREILWREFSFISGDYKVLVVSWMIIDLAMEMSLKLPALCSTFGTRTCVISWRPLETA